MKKVILIMAKLSRTQIEKIAQMLVGLKDTNGVDLSTKVLALDVAKVDLKLPLKVYNKVLRVVAQSEADKNKEMLLLEKNALEKNYKSFFSMFNAIKAETGKNVAETGFSGFKAIKGGKFPVFGVIGSMDFNQFVGLVKNGVQYKFSEVFQFVSNFENTTIELRESLLAKGLQINKLLLSSLDGDMLSVENFIKEFGRPLKIDAKGISKSTVTSVTATNLLKLGLEKLFINLDLEKLFPNAENEVFNLNWFIEKIENDDFQHSSLLKGGAFIDKLLKDYDKGAKLSSVLADFITMLDGNAKSLKLNAKSLEFLTNNAPTFLKKTEALTLNVIEKSEDKAPVKSKKETAKVAVELVATETLKDGLAV